jgi:catechol 2,3-dioxygenase-like lactoylglutathione lyase family enzyme
MREIFGPVGQIGYVVADLETAARRWYETTGIGPWRIMPHVPLDHFTYQGVPTPIDFGMATAYTGDVQIELIAQHDDNPSMYRELLDTYGEGAQHVCFYPDDYDAALAHALAAGMIVGQEGSLAGIRFAYLRGPDGVIIELGDLPAAIRAGRSSAVAEARGWDGTDPIRVRG